MSDSKFILNASSPDQPGIVANTTKFFAQHGFNIRESAQFEDVHTKRFFMRTVIEYLGVDDNPQAILQQFEKVAKQYQMTWTLRSLNYRPKLLVAVSRWSHCLDVLLSSWKRGVLPVDIVGVVSNHEDMRRLTQWYGVDYYHLPISKETKREQEQKMMALFNEKEADLLILARYMQILTDDMCQQLAGRAINIHHSFLPGFKGAKPYHQAYDRGVKLIGATAHFVTSDLDEGPIIEQAVERVSHANTPKELIEIGPAC